MNIFEKILYFILGLWFLFSASYYFIDAFKSVQSFYKGNKIREKTKKDLYKSFNRYTSKYFIEYFMFDCW